LQTSSSDTRLTVSREIEAIGSLAEESPQGANNT